MHEAISYAPRERLTELANRCLEGAKVGITAAPEAALVMVRVKETVDGEVFNLGEVLVTRCEVTLDGERGWGMIMGDDPQRALSCAVLDAMSRQGMPEELEAELKLALAFAREARRARWASVQPTRVAFEEMSP